MDTCPRIPATSRAAFGNSEFDQRRALIITYIYAVPSPKVGNALGFIARNWQVSGTTAFRDGLSTPLLTFGGESGVDNFHERPNCIGPIHYQLKDLTLPYVSASSFEPPAPGTFGNCPRNPDRRSWPEYLGYFGAANFPNFRTLWF